jgi:hypothetical protein
LGDFRGVFWAIFGGFFGFFFAKNCSEKEKSGCLKQWGGARLLKPKSDCRDPKKWEESKILKMAATPKSMKNNKNIPNPKLQQIGSYLKLRVKLCQKCENYV